MKPTTKALRQVVKHIDGAWVRVYHDGTAWAGQHCPITDSPIHPKDVLAALAAAGYRCTLNGAPGTAGMHVIDIKHRSERNDAAEFAVLSGYAANGRKLY